MSDNIYSYISRAEHLIEVGRHAEAIPLLTKALAIDPSDYQANALMALCFLELNRLEDSLKFAEKAIEADPEVEWGHRVRSLCLTQMGRHRDALKSAEEAARLEPEEPMALHTLTNARLQLKKIKQAKESAEQMLEVAPELDTTHFTMGNVQLASGDNYLAEQSFREAMRINPNSADARNNLGVAILRQKTNTTASMFGFRSNSIITPEESTAEHFHGALKLEPGNELAAENFRSQYSYAVAVVPMFAFIPFMMMTFVVIPLGTIVSLGITTFWSIRGVLDVRRKRAELSQEMHAFVKAKPFWGEDGVLNMFANTMWASFEKTWKPHLLALTALVIYTSGWLGDGSRSVSTLMMIGAFWWLVFESRRADF
jgi:Tfp pilus assembly protein PilF